MCGYMRTRCWRTLWRHWSRCRILPSGPLTCCRRTKVSSVAGSMERHRRELEPTGAGAFPPTIRPAGAASRGRRGRGVGAQAELRRIDGRSNQLSHYLKAHGVGPNVLVGNTMSALSTCWSACGTSRLVGRRWCCWILASPKNGWR